MMYWTGNINYIGPKTEEEWDEYFTKQEIPLMTPDEWYAKNNRDYIIHD